MGKNNVAGAWGESIAAEYLKKKRFQLVAMNYRCRFGEVDLIVSDKKYLVFVEVKLRKSNRFANAYEFVDCYKQQRIRTTAEHFLSEYQTKLQPRFDVVEIYAPEGVNTAKPVIRHMEDAFQ